jgi:hypothetical protein
LGRLFGKLSFDREIADEGIVCNDHRPWRCEGRRPTKARYARPCRRASRRFSSVRRVGVRSRSRFARSRRSSSEVARSPRARSRRTVTSNM